ncbi:MAG: hypothetical protein PHG94_09730 [Syntrophomonas sp.]|nr:hypothetical protein [Syntrophomonas sp.]
MERKTQDLSINLTMHSQMTPVILAAVENYARVCGMDKPDVFKLVLAVEEIFTYLSDTSLPGEMMLLQCRYFTYCLQVDFIFPLRSLNLRAFNLTTKVSVDNEPLMEEMGLLIASRSVEKLYFSRIYPDKLCLSIVKEKTYPEMIKQALADLSPALQAIIRSAEPEEIKEFCQNLLQRTAESQYPSFFNYPGKVIDMLVGDEYSILLAFDEKDHVVGGICWTGSQERTVECFGPYVFNDNETTALALMEECLVHIGRSSVPGIISRYAENAPVASYFERLGSTSVYKAGERISRKDAYYRQINEDSGSRVWAHPDIEGFLQEFYQGLFLPREIRLVLSQGEEQNQESVFTTEFDRGREQVTIRPLVFGEDAEHNLTQHINSLQKEKLFNIFLEMDLGKTWQLSLTPYLLSSGFKPCLLLPYAGDGDLLIFQFEAGDAL